ncbi:MAG: hypothetical protein A2Z44_03560 [Betaproteobacteria bacterium RBG_19FT_COMBO_58_11]|nr:MAG: hypothetical protein A2Z44_03560 [Betaproteobacteria bacterium RBG_19FT_COMBO_58_11]
MPNLTMLKRPLYSLILAFTLLFAQQGALWHGVSHTASPTNSQQDQQLPHSEQCAKCVAFAHTGAGAPATPLHFALPQLASAIAQFDAPAALPALHHPYQSRAPPILA